MSSHSSFTYETSGVARTGQEGGVELSFWPRKKCQNSRKKKRRKKSGKMGKNQEKIEKEGKLGRKGQDRESSFTLPLLTDRAGYATARNPFDFFFLLIIQNVYTFCFQIVLLHDPIPVIQTKKKQRNTQINKQTNKKTNKQTNKTPFYWKIHTHPHPPPHTPHTHTPHIHPPHIPPHT